MDNAAEYLVTIEVIDLAQSYWRKANKDATEEERSHAPDFTAYLPEATALFLACHQKVKALVAAQASSLGA